MVYKNNVIGTVCSCSLQTQTGVKLVAAFQIICSSLLLFGVGFVLVQQGIKVIDSSSSSSGTPNIDKSSRNVSIGHNFTYPERNVTLRDRQTPDTTFRMFVAYLIIFIIVGIFLLADVGLLKGAYQKIVGKCSMWCTVRYIRSVFAIIIFIAGFYKNQIQPLQSFVGVEIILNLCCVIIVQKFITELTSDQHELDKDWRQSSVNSNASSSSDSPWFTTHTTTPTQGQGQGQDDLHEEAVVDVDKENRRSSSVKSKSVTFAQ